MSEAPRPGWVFVLDGGAFTITLVLLDERATSVPELAPPEPAGVERATTVVLVVVFVEPVTAGIVRPRIDLAGMWNWLGANVIFP